MFSRSYWILTLLRQHLKAIVNENLPQAKNLVIVDYGCGSMPYRSLFESKAEKYLGIDLPAELNDDSGNSSSSTIPDLSADVVLSTQVLEHVESPGEYLAECSRMLKNDGVFILSTHGFWCYHPDPKDLWRWTGQGLKVLLKLHGFTPIRFEGLMGLTPAGLQLTQDGIYHRLPKILGIPFAFLMQLLVRITDMFHSSSQKNDDACVFLIVAQKAKS
jgi:SAM-dependent methyltransferase